MLAYSTNYNILHHIWHATSESGKVAEENEKWSSEKTEHGTLEKLKEEKEADETVHKRATRKIHSDSMVFFV